MNAMPSTAAASASVPLRQQQEQSGDSSSSTISSSNQINSFAIQVQGRKLLVPQTDFSRAVMGNETSSLSSSQQQQQHNKEGSSRPLSNLSLLLQQQQTPTDNATATANYNHPPPPPPHVVHSVDEADSACRPRHNNLGSSAPMMRGSTSDAQRFFNHQPLFVAPETLLQRHPSAGAFRPNRRYVS